MIRAFHTSATGMTAQQIVLDNTSNNLANVNTNGYKRSQIEFQDLMYTSLVQPGSLVVQGQQMPTGLQLGHGVRVASNSRLFTPGALENTGGNLDLAIQGDGFFKVSLPTGDYRYTRDGAFRLNSNRELVTSDGYHVEPRMTFADGVQSISVGIDGTVSAQLAGSATSTTQVGQLLLSRFPNPAGLSGEGRNLFAQTPASGNVVESAPGLNGMGELRAGFLERSNVDVVAELVNLIQAQRAYEFNTKAIRVADEMLSSSNELVR